MLNYLYSIRANRPHSKVRGRISQGVNKPGDESARQRERISQGAREPGANEPGANQQRGEKVIRHREWCTGCSSPEL